jgi:hypothetical protein
MADTTPLLPRRDRSAAAPAPVQARAHAPDYRLRKNELQPVNPDLIQPLCVANRQ